LPLLLPSAEFEYGGERETMSKLSIEAISGRVLLFWVMRERFCSSILIIIRRVIGENEIRDEGLGVGVDVDVDVDIEGEEETEFELEVQARK
jgi:hypothetical protein